MTPITQWEGGTQVIGELKEEQTFESQNTACWQTTNTSTSRRWGEEGIPTTGEQQTRLQNFMASDTHSKEMNKSVQL